MQYENETKAGWFVQAARRERLAGNTSGSNTIVPLQSYVRGGRGHEVIDVENRNQTHVFKGTVSVGLPSVGWGVAGCTDDKSVYDL